MSLNRDQMLIYVSSQPEGTFCIMKKDHTRPNADSDVIARKMGDTWLDVTSENVGKDWIYGNKQVVEGLMLGNHTWSFS